MKGSDMIEKYIHEDGKVAVLVGGGFGAGWSTWNEDYGGWMMFDAEIVKLVLEDKRDEIEAYIKSEDSVYEVDESTYICTSGAVDLDVVWVDAGRKFRINEYDGAEYIEYEHEDSWYTA
jgi:aspartate aminotransferase-like enzyme